MAWIKIAKFLAIKDLWYILPGSALTWLKIKFRLDRVVESDFADSGKTAVHAYLILLLLSMLIAIELVSFFGFSYIKSHSNFYSFD